MFEQQERMLFNNELFIERFKFARKTMGVTMGELSKYSSIEGKLVITKSGIVFGKLAKQLPLLINFLLFVIY